MSPMPQWQLLLRWQAAWLEGVQSGAKREENTRVDNSSKMIRIFLTQTGRKYLAPFFVAIDPTTQFCTQINSHTLNLYHTKAMWHTKIYWNHTFYQNCVEKSPICVPCFKTHKDPPLYREQSKEKVHLWLARGCPDEVPKKRSPEVRDPQRRRWRRVDPIMGFYWSSFIG